MRRGRQPRNCHVRTDGTRLDKSHPPPLTHSAAVDAGCLASLCLNCKLHEGRKMTMAGCHMPPPLFPYLPLAALLALTSFSITAPACSLLPPWLDTTFPPSGQQQCLLLPAADMHSSDLTKAARSHTFLCAARNLKCNACRQHRGLNTFQSRLTVLVTLADQSRYHPQLYHPLLPLQP